MPHLRFRGVSENSVVQLSTRSTQLAELINTDAGNFTFERIETKFFESGSVSQGYPFIEVLWFPRSQEAKQAVANFITKQIQDLEHPEYITVVFTDLEASSYFENGKHF